MLLPSVGDTVNERYRIEAVLARGGMGVVYRGTQLTMAREVAIKMVLAENQGSDRHLERFRREVQIAMRLKHPSVVEIYDFGQTADGMNFIVMEFLEGQDLKAVINSQGAFTVGRARKILEHVLDALCAAHESNVIHRDLKPSNIMLTRVGRGREFPKILDFGIAKSIGEHTELTMSGEVLGSIPYLAPEGLRGESPGFGVDVYAMGLITLEMLTGSRVRQGPNTAQIVAQHLTRDVTIPNEIQNTPLAAFIQRACSRDPKQRFPNAMTMYDALELAFKDIDPELVCRAPDVSLVDDPYAALVDEAPTTATPSGSGGFEEGRPTLLFAEPSHPDTASMPARPPANPESPQLQPRLNPATESNVLDSPKPAARKAPAIIGALLLGTVFVAVFFVIWQGGETSQEEMIAEPLGAEVVAPSVDANVEDNVEANVEAKVDVETDDVEPVSEPTLPPDPVLVDESDRKEVSEVPTLSEEQPATNPKADDSASKKNRNGDTQKTTSKQPAEDDDPFSVRKF